MQGISASSSAQAFSELVQCPKMAPSMAGENQGICTVSNWIPKQKQVRLWTLLWVL